MEGLRQGVVVMDENQKQIVELKTKISNLEHEIKAAKRALFELEGEETPFVTASDERIVEGVFNGENMEAPGGKIFPVPANYASKSKLVEGDQLKLTIGVDGSFVFKQIGPAERKNAIGVLKFENNAYYVEVDAKHYHVLYASVTYYKAKPGDRVSIIISGAVTEPKWCVLESILPDLPEKNELPVETIKQETPIVEAVKPINDEPKIVAPEAALSVGLEDSDKNQEELAHSEAKNNLKIDDLEIIGVKDNVAPEAVNPQEFSTTTTLTPTPTSTTSDTRFDTIQELEI